MSKLLQMLKNNFWNIYGIAISILFVIILYTNLDIYTNLYFIHYLAKYYKIALCILSIPILFRLVYKRKLRLNKPLILFVLLAAFIIFINLAFHFNDQELSLAKIQITGFVFLLFCYYVFQQGNNQLAARYTMLICLIIAVLINLIEVIHPGICSIDPGSSAGLYLNPNISAYALITGLILTINLIPSRMRVTFLIVDGAAIFSTMSRSGLAIWVIIIVFLYMQGMFHFNWKRADILLNSLVLLSLIFYFSYAYIKVPYFKYVISAKTSAIVNISKPEIKTNDNNAIITMVNSIIVNNNNKVEINKDISKKIEDDGSKMNNAKARLWLFNLGISLYRNNPIWGIGMGLAWSLSPHNIYLLYGLAYGLIGWLIVPLLALIIFTSGDRSISLNMAFSFLLIGMFSHNITTDYTILLPLALAAVPKMKVNTQACKIMHIITGLNTGGAEMMLYKLLSGIDQSVFKHEVISLTDIGPVGKKIQDLGIPVHALGMTRGVFNPLKTLQLAAQLRRDYPVVVQTWMYHANFIGELAAWLAGGIPVIWNIRQSDLDPQYTKHTTLWTSRICAWLSHWLPVRIICCSESAKIAHGKLGYALKKMVVIPNGFELTTFRPDSSDRASIRQELGVSEEVLVIGLAGRFDPSKDHATFIQAAARLNDSQPDVHFLLCGDDITWNNRDLVRMIEIIGIKNVCHLLGRRDDMPKFYAALDIATSSSSGEGFSNVIGEAMACSVPCVVTDVGDSALIVGDTGRVVPPKNPQALVDAWQELIEIGSEGRSALGLAARRRIEDHYILSVIVARYQELYKEVAACAG